MTSKELSNWKSVFKVSNFLKVTPQYVRQLINSGKLYAERKGSQWLIYQAAIDQYIQSYDVIIEPDDHPRLSTELPEIVALSFSLELWGQILVWLKVGLKLYLLVSAINIAV